VLAVRYRRGGQPRPWGRRLPEDEYLDDTRRSASPLGAAGAGSDSEESATVRGRAAGATRVGGPAHLLLRLLPGVHGTAGESTGSGETNFIAWVTRQAAG